jgi:hypothetical protein
MFIVILVMGRGLILAGILFLISCFSTAQDKCGISNLAFPKNEFLSYEVYYHWGLIWANAGSASFSVKEEEYKGRSTLHLRGAGATYKSYDLFYKVRDEFDTWCDTLTLRPFRYVRNTKEGSTQTYNDNYFNYASNRATCFHIIKGKVKKDSAILKDCVFDVLSLIYYSRCIDYSKYKPGNKIPIKLYLDGQIYDTLYIRYLGIEKIKTDMGEKECVKFKPLLISGTIFSGGEGMTVWTSNDEKKIPLLITTPIVVGEIQVKIKWQAAKSNKK